MKPRLRALVLAAGCGTRLRPLTCFLPKPLLPVCGQPVVSHTLRQLAESGCEGAVVNLHHLADRIPAALGQVCWGLPLEFSREEEIQGTLGALWPRRDFLARADLILLVNGDSLCRWPWRRLVRHHLKTGAAATLLLHRRPPEASLGGGVGVDGAGRIVQLRAAEPVGEVRRRHVFAGAHVLSPKLLDRLAAGPGDIVADLYIPLLRAGGHLAGLVFGDRWHDLGTAERYLAAVLDWSRGSWPRRRRSWISPLAEVHRGAEIVHSVVEERAVVGRGVRLEGSVILAGSRVTEGSQIRASLVGPGVELPAAAGIERRMINRTHVSHQPAAAESVMGQLIYTPLDS